MTRPNFNATSVGFVTISVVRGCGDAVASPIGLGASDVEFVVAFGSNNGAEPLPGAELFVPAAREPSDMRAGSLVVVLCAGVPEAPADPSDTDVVEDAAPGGIWERSFSRPAVDPSDVVLTVGDTFEPSVCSDCGRPETPELVALAPFRVCQ